MGWFDYGQLDRIELRLVRIEQKLDISLSQERKMALDLTALTAEVAHNKDVGDSVVALLKQLHDLIVAIPPSTDPTTQAALDELAASLKAHDDAIADAVVANTPAA